MEVRIAMITMPEPTEREPSAEERRAQPGLPLPAATPQARPFWVPLLSFAVLVIVIVAVGVLAHHRAESAAKAEVAPMVVARRMAAPHASCRSLCETFMASSCCFRPDGRLPLAHHFQTDDGGKPHHADLMQHGAGFLDSEDPRPRNDDEVNKGGDQ